MKNIVLVLLLLAVQISFAVAQTSLVETDRNEIKRQAIDLIYEFEDLLNFISDSHQTNSDIKIAIDNRLDATMQQRLFTSPDAIIEDDLNGSASNVKEVSIQKYLRDFDLFYEKAQPPNVNFRNMRISEVEKKKYVYVSIYFETVYLNFDNRTKKVIPNSKRLATVQAEKIDNRWVTQIASIVFGESMGIPIEELPEQMVNINRGTTIMSKSGGPLNALYSVAVPGLGNYQVGKKRPYWIISVVGYGLVGYGVATHIFSNKQYKQYVSAVNQDKIDAYYETANRNHLLSNYILVTGATLWLSDVIGVFSRGVKNNKKNRTAK